jgi:hypothetical protein
VWISYADSFALSVTCDFLPQQQSHPSRATDSLFAKRPGIEARVDRMIVFKPSSNSKTEQIAGCLSSDHSPGIAKQDFFRFWIESRHDNVDSYLGVYRWTVTGYDEKALQSDISAIAHTGTLDSVAPMENDGQDQPEAVASPSIDPRTIACVIGCS